jgi:diguanylate cyclase (GGDEF)-like protein/PAS domain S-box-containing protein
MGEALQFDPNIEKYRRVVANTPIIIYSMNEHGVFTLSEGLGLQSIGLLPGAVVGQSVFDIYKEYPDIIAAVHSSLAGETVFLTHCVNGTYFDNRMVPFRGIDGKVIGIVGAAIDITELKENQVRLEEKERHLQESYNDLLKVNQQVVRRNTILSTLEEITFSLLNQLNLEQLFFTIVTRAAQIVGAEDAFIVLPSEDGSFLDVKAGTGIYRDAIPHLPLSWGLMGKVYLSGKAELIDDYCSWEGRPDAPFVEPIRTMFATPLYAKQKIAGVLGVAYSQLGRCFDNDQIELLKRFAELASLALENASLHENLQHELGERIKSETTLSEIFNGVNEAIVVSNPETGEILWSNQRATEVFGYTEDEFKKNGVAAISTPAYAKLLIALLRKAISEGSQFDEQETEDKYGRQIIIEINAKRAEIHGKVLCLTLIRDITERKKMEKDLFNTETEKQAVWDAIPDTLLIFNKEGYLLEYKKAPDFNTPITSRSKAIGRNVREMNLPGEVVQNYLRCIDQVLETGKLQLYQYSLNLDGVKLFREVRFTKVSPFTVLALLRDITEMRVSQERVEFLSRHDLMTGVFDRSYFEEEIYRSAQCSVGGVSIIMCDVDGLKLINDTLGHAAGDEVLRLVASALRKTFTVETDVVARIGGDEFAVVTYHTDRMSIEASVNKFVSIIGDYNLNNSQLPVSVSVGWALDQDGICNLDALLKEADNMMYRQKIHQSQSMRSSIVQTMMKALEARDHITEGHADRLQELVEQMGKKLKLSGAKLADLRLFAQFHDIGKVGIPDYILNKPGKLTEEEFIIMKSHSDIGYRIALASPDLQPIANLILMHHEWWNGKGYPLGIANEEYPIECRILALADAYDAMTNDRPYRKALSHEAAIMEMRRCSGIQFDPNILDLFIEIVDESGFNSLAKLK